MQLAQTVDSVFGIIINNNEIDEIKIMPVFVR
jgi:hypothetical protein